MRNTIGLSGTPAIWGCNGVALTIGATVALVVNVGGELPIGELLAVACCAIFAPRFGSLLRRRWVQLFGVLWALCLAGQLLADIVNHTSADKMLRLDASLFMLLPGTLGVCCLLDKAPKSVLWLCLGLGLSALSIMIIPSAIPAYTRWKWGAAGLAAYASVGVASGMYLRTRRAWIVAAVLTLSGVVAFFTDARSIGGTLILVGVVLLLRPHLARTVPRSPSRRVAVAAALVSLLAVLAVTYGMYSAAAQSGILGEFARLRYESQTSSKSNPLVVSRIELAGSLLAIRDRPIFGHGAWAEDVTYINEVALIERTLGYTDPIILAGLLGRADVRPYIPIHSMILGSWVWGGILAPWLFVYIFCLGVGAARGALFDVEWFGPLTLWAAGSLFWNLPFTPFSGGNRFNIELCLAVCMMFSPVGAGLTAHYRERRARTRGSGSAALARG